MIDFAKLFESLALSIGVIDFLTACQVHDMKAARSHYLLAIVMSCGRLDKCCEHGMGSARHEIHACRGNVPVMAAVSDHRHHLLVVRHVSLGAVLKEGLPLVLSDLKLGLNTVVEQVINRLVVDLDILALDFEIDIVYAFVPKHGLIVECIFAC